MITDRWKRLDDPTWVKMLSAQPAPADVPWMRDPLGRWRAASAFAVPAR